MGFFATFENGVYVRDESSSDFSSSGPNTPAPAPLGDSSNMKSAAPPKHTTGLSASTFNRQSTVPQSKHPTAPPPALSSRKPVPAWLDITHAKASIVPTKSCENENRSPTVPLIPEASSVPSRACYNVDQSSTARHQLKAPSRLNPTASPSFQHTATYPQKPVSLLPGKPSSLQPTAPDWSNSALAKQTKQSGSASSTSLLPHAYDDKNRPPNPSTKALSNPPNAYKNHIQPPIINPAPTLDLNQANPSSLSPAGSTPVKASKLRPTATTWISPTQAKLVFPLSPIKVSVAPPEVVKVNDPTRVVSNPPPIVKTSKYLEYSGFPRLPRESNDAYESRIRRVGSITADTPPEYEWSTLECVEWLFHYLMASLNYTFADAVRFSTTYGENGFALFVLTEFEWMRIVPRGARSIHWRLQVEKPEAERRWKQKMEQRNTSRASGTGEATGSGSMNEGTSLIDLE